MDFPGIDNFGPRNSMESISEERARLQARIQAAEAADEAENFNSWPLQGDDDNESALQHLSGGGPLPPQGLQAPNSFSSQEVPINEKERVRKLKSRFSYVPTRPMPLFSSQEQSELNAYATHTDMPSNFYLREEDFTKDKDTLIRELCDERKKAQVADRTIADLRSRNVKLDAATDDLRGHLNSVRFRYCDVQEQCRRLRDNLAAVREEARDNRIHVELFRAAGFQLGRIALTREAELDVQTIRHRAEIRMLKEELDSVKTEAEMKDTTIQLLRERVERSESGEESNKTKSRKNLGAALDKLRGKGKEAH